MILTQLRTSVRVIQTNYAPCTTTTQTSKCPPHHHPPPFEVKTRNSLGYPNKPFTVFLLLINLPSSTLVAINHFYHYSTNYLLLNITKCKRLNVLLLATGKSMMQRMKKKKKERAWERRTSKVMECQEVNQFRILRYSEAKQSFQGEDAMRSPIGNRLLIDRNRNKATGVL